MKNVYHHTEATFEKVTAFATRLLGSSIPFILALGMVVFWLGSPSFYTQDIQHIIRDIIHAITFLSLFIIQKEFARFSGALHLKVNELIISHKPANNAVITAELKTEHEIAELSKEYTELAEHLQELADKKANKLTVLKE
jgi:low affinity Fe/Cu permease